MKTFNQEKNIKVRGNIIYIDMMLEGIRYRVSTKLKFNKKNIDFVANNYQDFLIKNDIIIPQDFLKPAKFSSKNVLFKDFAYKSLEINANNRKTNTNKGYLYVLEKHLLPYFGNTTLCFITSMKIKSWQNALCSKTTPAMINQTKRVFSTIIKDAMSAGLIDKNPLEAISNFKENRREAKPFSLEEIELIIKNARGFFKNMLTLAFFSGMRTGEMLALKWEDIDFKKNKITINKGMSKGILDTAKTLSSHRIIDMLPIVKQALLDQKQLSENEFVFTTAYSKNFLHASPLSKVHWHPLLKKLGLEQRTFYNTRHTFASLMISKGEDIAWVSKMMGHKNVAMTLSVYTKFIEEDTKRASFLDDFKIS